MAPAKGLPTAQTCHACAATGMEMMIAEVGGKLNGVAKTSTAGAALALNSHGGGVGQQSVVFPLVVSLMFEAAGIDAESSSRWEGGSGGRTPGTDCRAGIDAASFVGATQQLSHIGCQFVVDRVHWRLVGDGVVGSTVACPIFLDDVVIAIIVFIRLCYVLLNRHRFRVFGYYSVDDNLTKRGRK